MMTKKMKFQEIRCFPEFIDFIWVMSLYVKCCLGWGKSWRKSEKVSGAFPVIRMTIG